ncbi:MAG: RNA methyltransferase [Spirulinaceae cyanobacterium SM2_1_0]|nr:RNA methyltransferase [Spirulinaceae cyanobacterium SM2_1_0]
MTPDATLALVNHLSQFVTATRLTKMAAVLQRRTRRLTVVLDDLHKPYNASAVLRSCEAFGVQDVYAIETTNPFEPSKTVSRGAERWLTIYPYPDTTAGLAALRDRGYQLVAMSPHADSLTLDQLPLAEKLAIAFGSERRGLSESLNQQADLHARIPMAGFTESFNLSVSVAICLYELTQRLRASDVDWGLSAQEQLAVKLEWLRRALRSSADLEATFWQAAGAAALISPPAASSNQPPASP